MKPKLHRMEVGGTGAGEFSEADIERRARELARADGRSRPSEQDMVQARAELDGTPAFHDPAEEVAESDRGDAGSPVGSIGRRVDRVELEDEENLAARLVEEGIDEADHESRFLSNET